MRRTIVLLFLLIGIFVSGGCATKVSRPRVYPAPPPSPATTATADADGVPGAGTVGSSRSDDAAGDAVIEAAENLLGTPYRNGGTDPAGFDCSGFVQYVFATAGLALPRSVREQWHVGQSIERGDVRRGDLVFFAIDGDVSHVGIVLDNGTFIHAPSARGVVRVERLGTEYWSRRYAGARRVSAARSPTPAASGGRPAAESHAAGIAATRDRLP